MNSAREEVLGKIRRTHDSSTGDRSREYSDVTRRYRRTAELNPESRFELFAERLHDYGSTMECCGEADVGRAVAQNLSRRNARRLIVPTGVPADWLPSGFDFLRDEGLSYYEIDSADGVLTGCALAVALTGSIVLRHSAAEGRRAITLVPDYHLCVVFEKQLVERVPEAIEQMAGFGASPLTTISGPSATSDIEMTRVKGVHGPRTLDVIFVRS